MTDSRDQLLTILGAVLVGVPLGVLMMTLADTPGYGLAACLSLICGVYVLDRRQALHYARRRTGTDATGGSLSRR